MLINLRWNSHTSRSNPPTSSVPDVCLTFSYVTLHSSNLAEDKLDTLCHAVCEDALVYSLSHGNAFVFNAPGGGNLSPVCLISTVPLFFYIRAWQDPVIPIRLDIDDDDVQLHDAFCWDTTGAR